MIDQKKINEHFKVTYTIFLALITGMIMVFVVSLLIVQSDDFSPRTDIDNLFQIIIPLLGLIIMFFSRYLYNKQVIKVDKGSDLISKLNFYRTFKIVSFALIEGTGLLALIGFIITENYLYILVFIFLLGFLFMIRPSREGFITDFKISGDDTKHILRRTGEE